MLLWQIQRTQNQSIQHTKHYGVCANSQGQRQNSGGGESGRLAQKAKAETHVVYKNLDRIAAERLVAFFLVPLTAAELYARQAFCFAVIQPGALQIVRAVLDVGA